MGVSKFCIPVRLDTVVTLKTSPQDGKRPNLATCFKKIQQAYKLQDAKLTSRKNVPKYLPYIGIMLRYVALRVYLLFFLGGGGTGAMFLKIHEK